MLTPTGYWIAFVVQAALCASAAVLAARASAAPRHFALTWILLSVLFAGLGYLDWAAQPTKETSLTSYILGASLTPLVAIAVVWTIRRRAGLSIQWIAAGASAFLTTIGVAMAAYATGF